MHIPDGFLSTPVWLSLDLAAIPWVVWSAGKAQKEAPSERIPLLGVMGAFIFAAQMINFPVAAGASSHLLGSALLAIVLRPPAAMVVMTAILVIQALIFQDGGILALGANVFNMAILGVLVGYLPLASFGSYWRKLAIFLGAFLSVAMSGFAALAELALSGVVLPPALVLVSFSLFLLTGVIEGVVTLSVCSALGAIRPGWIPEQIPRQPLVLRVILGLSVLLVTVGLVVVSNAPDVLESLSERIHLAQQAKNLFVTPLSDYEFQPLGSAWVSRALAGLIGLLLAYGAIRLLGRMLRARRSE